MPAEPPSLLICGSVIPKQPDVAYLSRLRSSLIHDPSLADLRDGVAELPDLWSLLVEKEPSLDCVGVAPFLQSLAEWMTRSNSSALPTAERTSRNTRLAVLTVLAHIVEYMTYLQSHEVGEENEHASSLEGVRDGGIQGLCIGLLSAIALACSQNKTEVARHGAIAVRLALCVGAFVDLDETEQPEPTVCISARWPRGEGDGGDGAARGHEAFQALLGSYPQDAANAHPIRKTWLTCDQAYMGVRMDVCSATITAPKGIATSLMRHLDEKGAAAKQIDLQGRFHHPGHYAVFRKLADLCVSLPMLQFPQHSRPLVPLRRNDGGQVVTEETTLHEMALQCILVEKADWYTTMTRSVASMAQGAAASRAESKARVLALGPVDCIPRSVLAISPLQVIRPMDNGGLHHSYPDDSVAIIGASCRFPGSETPQQFWDMIRAKRTESSLGDAGCSFDSAFFRKAPREAEYMDPQHRLGLHLAHEALESGGHFSPSSSATDDIGCYVGMSSCDYDDNVNCRPPTAFSFTGTARAFASGRISHFFGLTGPSMVVDTACSSSAVAIHTACKAIQTGECSLALAGGVNLMTAQARSHQNLAAASFLSPTGQCRPFDAGADGYRRGEGGGFVLLKRLSSAVADNDCILGVLAASAVNNSKGSRSITLPSSESQSHLYRRVLQTAGMHPRQVSYVESHGTGTQKGDPVECQSIRQVFGGRLRSGSPPLRFGSVKGNVGHSEAASGLAALVKVLLMLQHRLIPPQANFSVLNPAIPSLEEANMEIPRRLEPWKGPFRAALVNNYGASGTNAAMIVCQPPPAQSERTIMSTGKPRQYPILVTAHSAASLRQYRRTLLRFIEAQHADLGDAMLPSVAFGLAQRQNHSFGHRTMFSASSTDELRTCLHSQVDDDDVKPRKTQGSPKPVVLLFAGQTGRRVRLSHEAYLGSILLQRHLDRCDRTLQTMGLHSLFPRIFDADPIDDLVSLHCTLFSLQYSVAASWIDAGLEAKAVVGHSLGQLTALCVSGVLTLRDALKLVSGRALLIQRKWGPERGCMLSVDADAATVEAITRSMAGGGKVETACSNASSHHVVVGTQVAIAAFEKAARSRDVSVKRLSVTHGFHSELVDCIMHEYRQLIQGLVLHPPTIPIEPCSKSSGSWANITPELIARQSRECVYFSDAISRVEQRLGSCVWLEAGSGSTAVTMARRALTSLPTPGSSSHSFYSVRLHDSGPMNSLADTTLGLWSEGVRVQFWLYHASQRRCFVPLELPPYQFEKSQHWLPIVQRHKESERDGQNQPTQEAPKLVSLVGPDDTNAQTVEFSINQHSEEYSTFVRGRTVFGQILVPASVYVESAARAFSLLPIQASSSGPSSASVEVGQVKLHAPFGLDLQRRLRLTLRKQTSSSWDFVVESHSLNDNEYKAFKRQASGTVRRQGQDHSYLGPHRPLLRRLYDRCEDMREDLSASVVQGAFVKKILGQVAAYDDSYFGIRSITSKGLEAVGDVATPAIASRCCAGTMFTPPVFDNFFLVAELHASSLGDLANDHVYICNGFDAVVPQIHPGDPAPKLEGPWLVLSSLDRENGKTIVCDIFVFSARHKTLSLAILGARLTQVPIPSLQKALEAMNSVEQVNSKTALGTSDPKLPVGTWDASSTSTAVIDDAIDMDSPRIRGDPHADLPIEQMRQEIHSGLSPRRGSVPSVFQLSATDDTEDSSGSSSKETPSSAGFDTPNHEEHSTALFNLLADHLNCPQRISPDEPLGTFGLDSLVAIQLQSDMEKMFGQRSNLIKIDENSTFSDLCSMILHHDLADQLGPSPLPGTTTKSKQDSNGLDEQSHGSTDVVPVLGSPAFFHRPTTFSNQSILDFGHLKQETSSFAQKTGFAGFFSGVYQKQMSLVLAYVLEAFSTLGCDLKTLRAGEPLPPVRHSPKYQRLMSRFHTILEDAGLISLPDGQSLRRTAALVPQARSSADMYREILTACPRYRPDHGLLNVTGSRLADCLSGRVDPLQLLFQDEASVQLLEDVYVASPMFATGNKMLGEFLRRVASHRQHRDGTDRLRILEIGAGTGATTQTVVDQLLACNVDFTYTFTDVSVALVASARKRFNARYGQHKPHVNLEFTALDIEKSPPASMPQSYDLVISSNCIHATRNLRRSCAGMEKLLQRDGGMVCLLELTRPLGWLDCVFGLLDGWWRFDDGRTYALAEEHVWKASLLDAGFYHVDWTDDGSRESQQFRLITAWR
ncbi:Polyketide synthase [Tolypocladium paradoxum]|uniref:Polyketide synthase n=1 Tax=Tolypocladium paradoxum TaxID=94208 RepID=A0A2S4L0T5_9HYPO|nr:Polyketide synthase [Tolypocladium paradoxum]